MHNLAISSINNSSDNKKEHWKRHVEKEKGNENTTYTILQANFDFESIEK